MTGFEPFIRFAKIWRRGEMIFSEFEPGSAFYLIQKGRVELVKILGGAEKILDILQPGDMFGEMAILENSPRSATAIALDDVTLLEFKRETFDILMRGNPQIAMRLLKIFTRRLYDTKRRYRTLALKTPEARVADVFLMLDESMPELNLGAESRDFPVRPGDIARWAGLNPARTRAALEYFASRRRLEVRPSSIFVKNINDFSIFVNVHSRR